LWQYKYNQACLDDLIINQRVVGRGDAIGQVISKDGYLHALGYKHVGDAFFNKYTITGKQLRLRTIVYRRDTAQSNVFRSLHSFVPAADGFLLVGSAKDADDWAS